MFQWLKSLFSSSPKPAAKVQYGAAEFAAMDAQLARCLSGKEGSNTLIRHMGALHSKTADQWSKVVALSLLFPWMRDGGRPEYAWIAHSLPAVYIDGYRADPDRAMCAMWEAFTYYGSRGTDGSVTEFNRLFAPESANV
jgi:hypothetical protein